MEDTIDISNRVFKNYLELCDTLGWKRADGKTKKCHLNKIQKEYEVTFKGHQIIFGKRKKPRHFNDDYRDKEKEYKKTLTVLNNPDKNNQYISNNLLLFIHYLKSDEDNRYGTYTVRQMREFGFLRNNLRPDYFTPQEELRPDGPVFKVNHDFSKEVDEELREQSSAKDCQMVFREIFEVLGDRYRKLMDASCAKFVNEESIATFGNWITKAQWEYFKKHYNQSINLMRRDMEMIGITDLGGGEYDERPLTSKETDTYFRIRNEIMEEEGADKFKYTDMSRAQARIFNRINKACKEELGFMVTYRKLYYSPLKDLGAFEISKEDVENARYDNNEKMRNTLKTYFRRKYLFSSGVYKIFEKCINYMTDLKVE